MILHILMLVNIILLYGSCIILNGILTKGIIEKRVDLQPPPLLRKQRDKDHFRNQSDKESLPLAWLMSFPNSGTSYTSYLVRAVTGQLTASNYKSENFNGSVAVFEELPEGPFFTDPDEKFPDSIRPTTGFLLTKTHCTGYCSICAAEEYIVSAQEFTQSCVEGDHILDDEGGEETVYSYSPDLVSRAVHIIRDPFDNIVSRFHLAHGDFVRTNQTKKVLQYPRTKAGFRSYCKYMGKRFHEEEMLSESYHDLFEDVQDIPCYNDFFRYIQWHNLAFTATEDLRLPTMIIHYENYTTNFDQTKDALLDFLDHDEIQGAPVFEIGKSYRNYFSEEEIQAVSRMFSELALETTWEQTSHYFVQ